MKCSLKDTVGCDCDCEVFFFFYILVSDCVVEKNPRVSSDFWCLLFC